jgi:hypothetical protein
MITFAADFWPVFWTIMAAGAALTAVVTLGIANVWSRERKADATLIELSAAYRMATEHERATAA